MIVIVCVIDGFVVYDKFITEDSVSVVENCSNSSGTNEDNSVTDNIKNGNVKLTKDK